jgi:hypothetical protein
MAQFLWVVSGAFFVKLDAQDIDGLRPVIEAAVKQVLSELSGTPLASGQIAFTEAQAAAALGIPKHQLRDARLRGDVRATVYPKMKQIMYSRRALLAFAEGNEKTGAKQKRRGKS